MDSNELSAAMIQDLGAVFAAALEEALPALLGCDRAEMEQRVRVLGRAVLGQVITRVIRLHATLDAGERDACPGCGGALACVDRARVRRLQGLVGDYTLHRVYYRCAHCGQGHVPLDARLGLGTGVLSPGLARVVCREGIDGAFENAVDSVAESLGVTLTAEVARRATEGMGTVAEAPVQAAMARVARGQQAWAAHEVEAPPASGVLAVEVDGLFVHRDDDWHERKVVTVAPLGPEPELDAETGRARLAWGEASYGAGFEEAQVFWGRAHVEACRRGLGTRAVRTVVLIADAADWIWHSGRAYLGLPGVELVEILDLYHVYEYLWLVGNTVFGAGTAAAAAWVEPLKTRRYAEGPAPVHAALSALADALRVTGAVADAGAEDGPAATVRRAIAYVTDHAARLDYPAFVARVPHRFGGRREQRESRGPSAHEGRRHALECGRRPGRGQLARAASLGALGHLLAGPAAARPFAPGPPRPPVTPPRVRAVCGRAARPCGRAARPCGPPGPSSGRPAHSTTAAAPAPRRRSSVAARAHRTASVGVIIAIHYFVAHPMTWEVMAPRGPNTYNGRMIPSLQARTVAGAPRRPYVIFSYHASGAGGDTCSRAGPCQADVRSVR